MADFDPDAYLAAHAPAPSAAPSGGFDPDAYLAQRAQAPSLGADLVKSGASGLERAAIGAAGQGGDVRSLIGAAADKIGIPSTVQKIAGTAALAPFMLNPLTAPAALATRFMPSSSDIQGQIEKDTGQPLYAAQTGPGRLVQTAAEFAPGALMGEGGIASRIAKNVLLPAAGSEAAGEMTGGNPYAQIAGGVLGGVLAHKAGDMVSNARQAVSAPMRAQAGNTMNVGGVDVPLTPGQVNSDVTSQRYVESARKGTLGEKAKEAVQQFDAAQNAAADQARAGVQGQLRTGLQEATATPGVADPFTAAQTVQQGVQSKAAQAKATAQGLYDQFGQLEGSVGADAFRDIGAGIKNDLSNAPRPYMVDSITTPAAAKMLDHLDQNLGQLKIQNKANPGGVPKATTETRTILAGDGFHIADDVNVPPNIAAISIEGLDRSRRELLSMARSAAPGSEDARASQAIIRAFDGRLQDAVNSHLYSGTPEAFDTLKAARRAWATYAQTFKGQGPGDMAGRIVEKMIGRHDQPASLNDIANWMYGANGMGGSSTSVAVYKKLAGIFGSTSPQMQGVRQGLFSRLTEAAADKIQPGPQKVSQRIFEFLNGQGRELAQVAFTPQERSLIDQYGQLQKRLTPVPGSINYSNTGHQLASMMKWTVNALATLGGLHVGGVPGAAAGFVANKAMNTLTDRVHAREVARQLYSSAASTSAPRATLASRALPYLRPALVSGALAANSARQ